MLGSSLNSLKFAIRQYHRHRKMGIWKPKHYEAIPHYIKPNFFDVHSSYELRSMQQINKQLQNVQFQINVRKHLYPDYDFSKQKKQRKAIIQFSIDQFKFTQLQLSRFKILMGQRFDQQTKEAKLTCKMFPTYDQNFDKINQMLYEIIIQSKRAP